LGGAGAHQPGGALPLVVPEGRGTAVGSMEPLDGQELPYTFVSVEQLVEDFIAAVTARRSA